MAPTTSLPLVKTLPRPVTPSSVMTSTSVCRFSSRENRLVHISSEASPMRGRMRISAIFMVDRFPRFRRPWSTSPPLVPEEGIGGHGTLPVGVAPLLSDLTSGKVGALARESDPAKMRPDSM